MTEIVRNTRHSRPAAIASGAGSQSHGRGVTGIDMLPFSPLAAIALTLAIFIFDTLTPFDIAVAVLYVAVVLLSLNFANRRGLIMIAGACMALTVLSFLLAHNLDFTHGAVARCCVSLAAIGISTLLALRLQAAIAVLGESERRYKNIFLASGVAILEMDFSGVARLLDEVQGEGIADLKTLRIRHPDLVSRGIVSMRVINANETTFKVFGARNIAEYAAARPSLMGPEMHESFWEMFETIRKGGRSFEAESVMKTLDGRRLNILYTIVIPDDGHRLDTALVTIMDVTARRSVENGLLEAQAELAHVSRIATMGELTASIAHEVNQPLAAIVTNGEAGLRWLRRDVPDLGEGIASVQKMIDNARRAGEVIKKLRALSSKTMPQAVPIDLNEIVDDALLLVQREIASREVSFTMEMDERLPPVLGDRVQLQQVLINLIMNAVQAMADLPAARRNLTIRTESVDGAALVRVTDSGPGFDPAAQTLLFKPFHTTKADGMGMGLSICRSIIEAHGGRIQASPAATGGAVFEFSIPSKTDVTNAN